MILIPPISTAEIRNCTFLPTFGPHPLLHGKVICLCHPYLIRLDPKHQGCVMLVKDCHPLQRAAREFGFQSLDFSPSKTCLLLTCFHAVAPHHLLPSLLTSSYHNLLFLLLKHLISPACRLQEVRSITLFLPIICFTFCTASDWHSSNLQPTAYSVLTVQHLLDPPPSILPP